VTCAGRPVPAAGRAKSCIVADDHPAIVEAVSQALEACGIKVAARASDGEQALEEIRARQPAVAVLDVRMPRLSGIEVARRAPCHTAVILYTGYADRALVIESLDAGARGYVLKESPVGDLVRAVETVADGGTWVDPVLAGSLAAAGAKEAGSLTAREREVLRLLADGCSNEEIGRRLYLSPETVRSHVHKAMRKLEADTRTQAVATALRRRLIA